MPIEKITITIDQKKIQAEKGENLLQIARDNGIQIPSLCYHKKLTPTAACRLCIVKIENQRGFVASCTHYIEKEVNVTAFDQELEEHRKLILEYLISEHNLKYDYSYFDEMRDLLLKYDLLNGENLRTKSLTSEIDFPIDDSSPVLTYDASKCIKCFRCIKACSEVQGKNVLNFSDRGIQSYIIAGSGVWKESECDGCGECVQLCPTGAIVEKPYRNDFDLRKIEKRIITVCPYCGVGCNVELFIRDNKIVRANGVPDILPNDGRLCVKGRFGYEYVQHPDRLKTPLIKENGKFRDASWEEAITLIAKKFNEIKEKYGSQALAGYASAKCTNEENYLFQKFVRVVFGSNNIDYCTRLCHASTVTAMLKSIGDGAGSNSIEDFENTDCIFITGNNMIETHPVTATYVKRGKAKGTKIIVADPKWTPMVKYADVWLQMKLGTDVALLNGLIHIIIKLGNIDKEFIKNRVSGGMEAFEALKKLTDSYTPESVSDLTGIAEEKLYEAAQIYSEAKTALIATGMGMSQQVTGTNNVFSLMNMMFICGHIGKELCGINPPRGQNNVQGATDVGASPIVYPGYIPVGNEENRRKVSQIWNVPFEDMPSKPGLTTVEIVNAAHEGKIKAMYVMGENPMITDPNLNHTEKALEGLEFLVVQDIFPTDTTPLADVVLPAATFGEKDGSVVNSDRRVMLVRKALDAPGQALPDWQITCKIADKMGKSIGSYASTKEIFDEIASVTPMMAGISYDRIQQEGIQWPCPEPNHPGTSTLFKEKFNTPDGKAKLFPVEYIPQSEKVSTEFPFILNSGRILYQYHTSTLSRRAKPLRDFANESYVLMNPVDVEKNDFTNGQRVKVSSKQGCLETTLQQSDEVAPGELFMPWHFNESQVNRLTRSELDPNSKIAAFKLTACKVEPVH